MGGTQSTRCMPSSDRPPHVRAPPGLRSQIEVNVVAAAHRVAPSVGADGQVGRGGHFGVAEQRAGAVVLGAVAALQLQPHAGARRPSGVRGPARNVQVEARVRAARPLKYSHSAHESAHAGASGMG